MALASMIVLILLYVQLVIAQSTTLLPPPPLYSGGRFTSPDTSNTQIFSEGSTMNVSWSTKYPSVHLYLLTGTDYNNPRTCLFGSTKTFWEWDVDDSGNNTLPFSFRIVNAEGTEEDLSGGGFYTGQFWIRSDSDSASSKGSTIDATTTTSHSTSSDPANTKTSVSDLLATTSSSVGSVSSTMPTTTPSSTFTAVENTTSNMAEGGLNTTAIGAGVGTGAGVAITALTIAIWIFCRRHRRQNKEQHHNSPTVVDTKEPSQIYEAYAPQHQQIQAKGPYPHEPESYFSPRKAPVEVPSGSVGISELEGSDVHSRTR